MLGAVLDFATEQNALDFAPAVWIFGSLGAGALGTIWAWFRRSDADKARHEHAKLDSEIAVRNATDQGKTLDEATRLGEVAYQKSMGTYDQIQLIKKGLLTVGVLGGGYLLLKIIKEFKR